MAPLNLGALKFAGKISQQARIRREVEKMSGLELAPSTPQVDGSVCFFPELHEWIQERLEILFPKARLPIGTTHEELFDVVLKYSDKVRLWNFLTRLAKQSNVEHAKAADPDERKSITTFVEDLYIRQSQLMKKSEEERRQQSLQEFISKQERTPKAGWQKNTPTGSAKSVDQVRLKRRQAPVDHEGSQSSTGPRRVHLAPLMHAPPASGVPSQSSAGVASNLLPEDEEYHIPPAMHSLSLAKSIIPRPHERVAELEGKSFQNGLLLEDKKASDASPTSASVLAIAWQTPRVRKSPKSLNTSLSSVQALHADGVQEDPIDKDLRTSRNSRPVTAATSVDQTGSRPMTGQRSTAMPSVASSAPPSSWNPFGSWGYKSDKPRAEADEMEPAQANGDMLRKVQRSRILGLKEVSGSHDGSHEKNLFGAQGPSWWSLRLK